MSFTRIHFPSWFQTASITANSLRQNDRSRASRLWACFTQRAGSRDLIWRSLPWGYVREKHPDMRIIAFGSQRPQAHLPLPKGAQFYYRPAQQELKDLYSACDVWITASRSEGFNLPAMEAMACRTPVVSTRTGWPMEAVVTGYNGCLVDVEDETGFVEGIDWILSRSTPDWELLSAQAHATVASTSWVKSTELFERALRNACERASRGEISRWPVRRPRD